MCLLLHPGSRFPADWLTRFPEITAENFFGPRPGQQPEVLQGNHYALNVAKHSGESEAEEHDEEEDGPERRDGHFDDGFCEHDEGQSCSLHTLERDRLRRSSVSSAGLNSRMCNICLTYLTEELFQITVGQVQRFKGTWVCLIDVAKKVFVVALCDGVFWEAEEIGHL